MLIDLDRKNLYDRNKKIINRFKYTLGFYKITPCNFKISI